MMNLLSKELSQLKDDLPPAVFRLLDVIFKNASQSTDDEARWTAVKDVVLKQLEDAEGKVPTGEIVRQRLKTFRVEAGKKPGWSADDMPLIAVRSTKAAFEITTNLDFIKAAEREQAKSVISKSGHDDFKNHLGSIEPVEPRFELPIYSVFISHHWEEDEKDEILDEFVQDLTRSLRKLPSKWSDKFRVEVIYDRAGAFHGRNSFEAQSDGLCEKSAFAIFMLSNGWCQSSACQKEAVHFKDRGVDQEHYLAIQFINQRGELPKVWRSVPNYPSFKPEWKAQKNLLSLWEQPPSVRADFIDRIRDEVCAFLEEHDGPVPPAAIPTTSPSPPIQSISVLRERKIELDVPSEKLVEARMLEEKGGDTTNADEDGVSAVQTLYNWATDSAAKHRTVILLGGFGMGKTTTVQMLHERLYQDATENKDTPIPIYLDFRRLIPKTEHGSALDIDRDELIASALNPDVKSLVGQKGISDMIRNENCLLIFDGLDEVGNRIGREYAAQLYRQFLELIPSEVQALEAEQGIADWSNCKTRLIVTCRTHFFRSFREQNSMFGGAHRRASITRGKDGPQNIPGARLYHMAPLTLPQIEELFTKYLGDELGSQTMELIRNIHDLPGLAQRPIMARFISEVAGELVKIHESGRPINIATVYDELFQLGLERDAEKRPLLKPQDREEMLISLAAYLHSNALGPQSADDLEKWFDGFAVNHNGMKMLLTSGKSNCRDLLHTELENASFLVRDESDRFRFAHTSYFEYFLGLAIAKCNSKEAFAKLMQRPASSETYKFVYAIAENEDQEAKLLKLWKNIVCSDEANREARVSAFQLIAEADDWTIPDGANLSDFSMKNFRFKKDSVLKEVNFTNTQLNGLDARNVTFEGCNFTKANIANAAFEDCHFDQCIGAPNGLSSARGVATNLPTEWAELVKGRLDYWQERHDPRAVKFVFKSIFASVAFRPDGQRLVTGSDDGTARVWDAQSGAEVLKLEGHRDWVQSVGFRPDGQRLVTGSDDGTARVWDAQSGAEVLKLEGHGGSIRSVGFSPDGQRLLIGSHDGTARVWDAQSGAEVLKLEGHGGSIRSVGFSPDGQRLVTGSDDDTARVWDAQSGVEVLKLEGHGGSVICLEFRPDGQRIVTGSDDGTARVWDAQSGAEVLKLEGHGGLIISVGFSPDGQRLVTSSDDDTARVWDAQSGAEVHKLEGHGGSIRRVGFSPDGQRLVTGSYDGTAQVWDAQSGAEVLKLEGHGDWVQSVGFSPDGRRFVTGSDDGIARVWDAQSGDEVLKLEGHGGSVRSVGFSPDGQRLVTGSDDGTARVWDAQSGAEALKLEGYGGSVFSVTFSPDGQRLVTGSSDGLARVWDAQSGDEVLKLEGHGGLVISVGFSPDGQRLVTGSYDRTARVWDAQSGVEDLKLERHGNWVQSVGFSPDGQRLLIGSNDYRARVWDAQSGAEVLKLEGHGGLVQSVGFRPDGQRLVTGSDDGTARVWDAQSGEEVLKLEGHGGSVRSVGFSPDGQRLLTGSSDRTARVWNAQSGEEIYACVGLPESWAVLEPGGSVKQMGPNFWRYAA